MKLLLDQGLPRTSATLLRDMGIDTIHVGEIGQSRASDLQILHLAYQDNRCVVTLDADFHAFLAVSGSMGPSVIWIRVEGLRGEPMARLIVRILEACSEILDEGAVATFRNERLRVRRLPVRRD